MKQIQPLSIWGQGSTKDAVTLNAYVVNLQLNTSATFYYALLSEANETLAQGNLTMQGEDYLEWAEDENAWGWIAKQLNVTIIGDFVTPVVELASIEDEPVIDGEELTEPEVIEPSEPTDLTEEI